MVRRLIGSDLLKWHLAKKRKNLEIDSCDPQYNSQNLNPLVYRQVYACLNDGLDSSKFCSILEFGARAGFLGQVLSTDFPKVVYTGVEPYPPKEGLFQIYEETCEGFIGSPLGVKLLLKTDIIVYADVLEHLADPWSHLQALFEFAKPETKLIISLPNFFHHSSLSLISSGEFNYEEWGVLDLTHLRFFGLENMLQMLALTGWEVDKSSIQPAVDPQGREILDEFYRSNRTSWSSNKLTWRVDSEHDAMSLAAYQFVMTANKSS